MGGGRYFGLGECYFWGCNFMCVRFYFVCGGVPYMGCVHLVEFHLVLLNVLLPMLEGGGCL